jgi:hypothetical protein
MRHLTFPVLAFFAMTFIASAQTEQQISGTVSDESGAAVPNAAVTVTNEGTGATRTATANSEGNYVVASIPNGTYTVSVAAPSFKTFVTRGVVLRIGSRAEVNARLSVGEVTEKIQVEAQALQVETTTGEVGHVVTGAEAMSLQLNGRNYINLIAVTPGTSSTYTSAFRGLYGPYGNLGAAYSVNGSKSDSNTFMVNNVDDKDPGGPSSNSYVNVSPDFIAEFKTIAANQSAQYGLNAGATITIALKTGGKEFHGTAYEYFRNDAIQARTFNSPSKKPPLRYNNFGWSGGGPIFIPGAFNTQKEKAFFFVGQDVKRRRTSDIVGWNVPSLAQRQGTGVLSAGQTADPMGQTLVNLYPVPSPAGSCTSGNFCFANPSPMNATEYIGKIDYIFSPVHQIAVHYMHDSNRLLGGNTLTAVDAYNYTRTIPGFLSGLQWTAVINPTTVNSVTLGFAGNRITEKQEIRPNPALGFTTAASLLRSTYGLTYPTIFNVNPSIPTVQIAGFNNLSVTPLAFDNVTRTYTIRDDFSKVLGSHTLKTGLVAQRGRKNQDTIPALNGTFAFNSLSDALQGKFFTYTEGAVYPIAFARFTNIEPYFQDDWKVNKRLTLNLGLRWAYSQPVYLALANGTNFLPQFYDSAKAAVISAANGQIVSAPGTYDRYNGLVLPGSSFPVPSRIPASLVNDSAVLALFKNQPQGFVGTNYGTWSPRVGLAYDLTGKQTTVLRGGFGITYERIRTTAVNTTATNPPFVANVQVRNGLVSNPPGGTTPSLPVSIPRALDPNLKNPRITNWTVGLQHSLGARTVLELTYVGAAGRDLTYLKNINQLPEGTIQANPTINPNALRTYKGYTDILALTNGGVYNYESLQAQLQKRLKGEGFLRIAYTWSKNLTDDYDFQYIPMDSYHIGRDYGPAPLNRPHVLVISYNYPLPFWQTGNDWYKKLFGGWSLTGIVTYQSGWPLNAYVNQDIAGVGGNPSAYIVVDGSGGGGNVQRADVIGDPYANTTRTQALNPAAFAVPTPGRYGTAGAFAFHGPRISNFDVTAAKDFRLTERFNVNFRAEMFNIFNHLSYTGVNTQVGTATFGRVNGAMDPRTFEFAIRLRF